MKKISIAASFLLLPFLLCSQCYKHFIPMDCYVPEGISLDSMLKLTLNRYRLYLFDFKSKEDLLAYSQNKYDYLHQKFNERTSVHDPDSLFRFSRKYIAEKLGEDLFCKRVRMGIEDFKCERNRFVFVFQFHYQDIDCWNGKKADIVMTFLKNKDGSTTFLPPDNLPDCADSPADCTFSMLTYPHAVDIVEEAGLLDIATPYDVDTDSKNHRIIIKTAEQDCRNRFIGVDMRTGKIVQDTVFKEKYTPCPDWRTWSREADVIVEATGLKRTNGYYFEDGYIYTSHIFQVNKVFKGDPGGKIIELPIIGGTVAGVSTLVSHTVRLFGPGYSGILFLDTLAGAAGYQSEDSLLHYPKWRVHSEPLDYISGLGDVPLVWGTQIHPYLYPELEAITGKPHRTVSQPILQDSTVRQWLAENGRDRLQTAQALQLSLGIFNIDPTAGTARVELYAKSAFDFSYPSSLRFLLSYNTAAFGDSLVAKGLFQIDRDISHSGIGRHHMRHAFFPKYYEITARDISSGRIELLIEKRPGDEPFVQLPGFPDNAYNKFIFPLLAFHLPIVNDSVEVALRLENDPFGNDFRHFDFLQNKEEPYAYYHLENEADSVSLIFKTHPYMKKIVPDTIMQGKSQQVEIVGKNFYGRQTSVFVTCAKKRCFKTHRRLLRLPDDCIKYRSGGHIKFVLPEGIQSNDKRLGTMTPCSGPIRTVNSVGDLERVSESLWLEISKQ